MFLSILKGLLKLLKLLEGFTPKILKDFLYFQTHFFNIQKDKQKLKITQNFKKKSIHQLQLALLLKSDKYNYCIVGYKKT